MGIKKRQFIGKVTEFSRADFGYSGKVFKVKSITKNKIYEEYKNTGTVVDDNECTWFIGTNSFNERFQEII